MGISPAMPAAAENFGIQKVLHEEFGRLRAKNPAFSLRALARRIAIPAPALSEILQGKRGVSRKRALLIADKLLLDPERKTELLSRFPARGKRDGVAGEQRERAQLTMDHFHTVSEWYHFAILSLAETQGFDPSPEAIALRLGLSRAVVVSALDRLLRLGMIERGADGGLRATGVSYQTPDDIASVSLRRAHAANLELAAQSLANDPVEERDFTSLTVAVDPARLPGAKKRIRKFLREMSDYFEAGEKKEVYKMCIQAFPLSKKQGT